MQHSTNSGTPETARGPLSRRKRGYTILEMIVTGALLLIIAGISVPVYKKWRERAKEAVCRSKLKTIHAAFSSAIIENGGWPQIPITDSGEYPDWNQSDYYEFWVKTMEPYGIGRETWVCPSDDDAVNHLKSKNQEIYKGSYIPTWFSPGPNIPFRWNQPWLTERAGFHGKGHLVVMPDGSITETTNPFGGR